VNAVSAGSAKITAKVGDTALTCKVNVKEPEVEYTDTKDIKESYYSTDPKSVKVGSAGGAVKVSDTKVSEPVSEAVSDTVKSAEKSKTYAGTKSEKINKSEQTETSAQTGYIGEGNKSTKQNAGRSSHGSGSSSKSERGHSVNMNGQKGISSKTDDIICACELSEQFITVEKGAKITLKGLTIKGAEDNALVWSVTNSKVAEVKNGVISAKSVGSVIVKAVTVNGKVLTCKVKVIAPQTGKDVKLSAGKTFKFSYINAMTWKSSNPDVVSVNERGVIKAVKKGVAEVSCVANGKTIVSKVEVN
ncbi:MAG: Ig-like domain-containing protein, partial [Armatimonadetes bacterium]|nr:Ig-like domain-containing protein [Candidatus Hippobium faecium]